MQEYHEQYGLDAAIKHLILAIVTRLSVRLFHTTTVHFPNCRQRPGITLHPPSHTQTQRTHETPTGGIQLWRKPAPTSCTEPYQQRIPCMARVSGASSLHPPAEGATLRRRRRRRRAETEDGEQRCCEEQVDTETEAGKRREDQALQQRQRRRDVRAHCTP